MAQYIQKDALVEEIERRQKIHFNDYHINGNNSPADYGACNALTQILSFIESLDVKEVDLEKETTHYLLHEHLSPLNEIMHQADLNTEIQYHKDIENAFKAGFELGMAVNNKAQKGE